MDSKDLAIGILSTTAVILLVGVAIVGSRPRPVLADGMTASRGDYIVTVGGSAQVDEDYVYVIDVPEQKIIAYRFNTPRKQIDVVQGIDLGEIRKSADPSRRTP